MLCYGDSGFLYISLKSIGMVFLIFKLKDCLTYAILNLSSIFGSISMIQRLGQDLYTEPELSLLFLTFRVTYYFLMSMVPLHCYLHKEPLVFYWSFNILPLVQSLQNPGTHNMLHLSLKPLQSLSAFVHCLYL